MYHHFQELVQNADDAGASIVKFLFDNRRIKDDFPISSEAIDWHTAPAFVVVNDGRSFNSQDWENLNKAPDTSSVGSYQVGHFGTGFYASCHIAGIILLLIQLLNNPNSIFYRPLCSYQS